MRKNFSFIYPVTKRKPGLIRKGDQAFEHVTDLIINGDAIITQANILNNISNKYEFEIHEILFQGKNIYPHTGLFDSLENIKAACANHVDQLLQAHENKEELPITKMYPALAKVITMPLKRKVK